MISKNNPIELFKFVHGIDQYNEIIKIYDDHQVQELERDLKNFNDDKDHPTLSKLAGIRFKYEDERKKQPIDKLERFKAALWSLSNNDCYSVYRHENLTIDQFDVYLFFEFYFCVIYLFLQIIS